MYVCISICFECMYVCMYIRMVGHNILLHKYTYIHTYIQTYIHTLGSYSTYMMSFSVMHKVGKTTWKSRKSMWGFRTLYVGLISTDDATQFKHILHTYIHNSRCIRIYILYIQFKMHTYILSIRHIHTEDTKFRFKHIHT